MSIEVAKHLQIQTLLQNLPDDTDAESLKLILVSVLAQSPEEQEKLYGKFDACVQFIEQQKPLMMEKDASIKLYNSVKYSNFKSLLIVFTLLGILLTIGGGLWWKTQRNKPIETLKQIDSTQISPIDTLNIAQKPQNTEGGKSLILLTTNVTHSQTI